MKTGCKPIHEQFFHWNHTVSFWFAPVELLPDPQTNHGMTGMRSGCTVSKDFPHQGHLGSTEEGHRAIAQWRRGEGKLDLNGTVGNIFDLGSNFWKRSLDFRKDGLKIMKKFAWKRWQWSCFWWFFLFFELEKIRLSRGKMLWLDGAT